MGVFILKTQTEVGRQTALTLTPQIPGTIYIPLPKYMHLLKRFSILSPSLYQLPRSKYQQPYQIKIRTSTNPPLQLFTQDNIYTTNAHQYNFHNQSLSHRQRVITTIHIPCRFAFWLLNSCRIYSLAHSRSAPQQPKIYQDLAHDLSTQTPTCFSGLWLALKYFFPEVDLFCLHQDLCKAQDKWKRL